MSHTPGLWVLRGLTVYGKVNGRDEKIADARTLPCIGGHDDVHAQKASDQEQANARLIAAAPELLAALEACAWWLDHDYPVPEGMRGLDAWDQKQLMDSIVLSAIAKAKGEA